MRRVDYPGSRNAVTQVFVFLFIDSIKKEVQHGVDHGSARLIEFQVGLGDVGSLMSTVDQYVVPGWFRSGWVWLD